MTEKTSQIDFHVHSVLDMLFQENKSVTVAELHQLIVDKFGSAARFSSCSHSNMDTAQTIQFLFNRQKMIEIAPGQYKINIGNSCGH